MRNYFLLLFTSMVSGAVMAQNPKPKANPNQNHRNIISINPGAILQNFAYYPVNNNQENEYTLMYHRIIGNANGIRLGTNFASNSNNVLKNDSLNGLNNSSKIKLGIGYERFSYLSKSWTLYYGMDVQLEQQQNNNKTVYQSSNSVQTYEYHDTANTVNVYPFVGVQAKLNQRINIGMETGYKFGGTNAKSSQYRNSNGIITNDYFTTEGDVLQFVRPYLVLNIRF